LLCNDSERVTIIPNTEKNYKSLSKYILVDSFTNEKGNVIPIKIELRFIDTLRFLPAKLESLAAILTNDQLTIMSKYYEGEQFELIRKKGIYPTNGLLFLG
jgi:hypothetical protein